MPGAKTLCTRFLSPGGAADVRQSMDCQYFKGRDATGLEVSVPAAPELILRLFNLLPNASTELHLPTYKRTPISELLSHLAKFPLEMLDLVTLSQLEKGIAELQRIASRHGKMLAVADMPPQTPQQLSILHQVSGVQTWPCDRAKLHIRHRFASLATGLSLQFEDAEDVERHLQELYFDGCEAQVAVKVQSCELSRKTSSDDKAFRDTDASTLGPPMLSCGWPVVVGVYKSGVLTRSTLLSWGTCENIHGSLRQAPVRASIEIAISDSFST